jgi:hypothetical protein
MLKVKTEEQYNAIYSIIPDVDNPAVFEEGVSARGLITFDQMAAIVDYLRKPADKNTDLFEECWKAYRRKGNKKKSKEYWNKLKDTEMERVLPHIKAYVSSRDVNYQKDFERYLRDKVFDTVVFNGNNILFDPTKIGKGETASEVYMPICEGGLTWNEYYKCYMYIGFWDGSFIPDGYTEDNRPNGASVTLNNGRGTIVWDSETKTWNKV